MLKIAGYLVETISGKGRTFHSEQLLNGKIIVHLDSGKNVLVSREKIKIIGYVD